MDDGPGRYQPRASLAVNAPKTTTSVARSDVVGWCAYSQRKVEGETQAGKVDGRERESFSGHQMLDVIDGSDEDRKAGVSFGQFFDRWGKEARGDLPDHDEKASHAERMGEDDSEGGERGRT